MIDPFVVAGAGGLEVSKGNPWFTLTSPGILWRLDRKPRCSPEFDKGAGGGPLLPGLNFLPFNCSSYIVGHNFAGFREGRAVPRPA